jgi:hypothetical protein
VREGALVQAQDSLGVHIEDADSGGAPFDLDVANGEDLEGFLLPLGLIAAGSGLAAL